MVGWIFSGRASSRPRGAAAIVSSALLQEQDKFTLLDSLGDLGRSSSMRDILVVLGRIYLVGIDVLVGVSVVDLCVSELFSLFTVPSSFLSLPFCSA